MSMEDYLPAWYWFPENFWIYEEFEDADGGRWKEIPRHRGYYIGDCGVVISQTRMSVDWEIPFPMSTWSNQHGHQYLRIEGETLSIHRLVAEAFIPNPNNYPLVRHLDGDPHNNDYTNLAWGTQKDNMRDMFEHGNDVHRPVYCIETEEWFRSIKRAAEKYGVASSCIANACKGKTNSAAGYHFCYADEKDKVLSDPEKYIKPIGGDPLKPVKAINIDSGEERIFKSRREASEELGLPNCGISSVLSGHIRQTHRCRFEDLGVTA